MHAEGSGTPATAEAPHVPAATHGADGRAQEAERAEAAARSAAAALRAALAAPDPPRPAHLRPQDPQEPPAAMYFQARPPRRAIQQHGRSCQAAHTVLAAAGRHPPRHRPGARDVHGPLYCASCSLGVAGCGQGSAAQRSLFPFFPRSADLSGGARGAGAAAAARGVRAGGGAQPVPHPGRAGGGGGPGGRGRRARGRAPAPGRRRGRAARPGARPAPAAGRPAAACLARGWRAPCLRPAWGHPHSGGPRSHPCGSSVCSWLHAKAPCCPTPAARHTRAHLAGCMHAGSGAGALEPRLARRAGVDVGGRTRAAARPARRPAGRAISVRSLPCASEVRPCQGRCRLGDARVPHASSAAPAAAHVTYQTRQGSHDACSGRGGARRA